MKVHQTITEVDMYINVGWC